MAQPMRERIVLERRESAQNIGGVVRSTSWSPLAGPMAARLQPLRGGEKVLAGRLAGVQSYVVTVRSTPELRAVCAGLRASDRARNTLTGELYNIRSVQNPDERNAYLALMCETGVNPG